MEKWLDTVEPMAKEIYQVLVVHQRQKMPKSEGEFHFENFPNRFGSILIKLSKLRLNWRAIASLEHSKLLVNADNQELDYVEILIREIYDYVVVQQVLLE